MSMNNHGGLLVARLLIGAMFVATGIWKLTDMDVLSGLFTEEGYPAPTALAWAVTAIELVGGLMLVLGLKARQAACGLTVFLVLATALMHNDVGDPTVAVHLLKNIAIVGGLIALWSAPSERGHLML